MRKTKSRNIGFRDAGRREFRKHVQHQFFVGHVVTQVFFLQALEFLVFFGCFACPMLINDVGEGGILYALLYVVELPLVGQVLAYLNTFEALV